MFALQGVVIRLNFMLRLLWPYIIYGFGGLTVFCDVAGEHYLVLFNFGFSYKFQKYVQLFKFLCTAVSSIFSPPILHLHLASSEQ